MDGSVLRELTPHPLITDMYGYCAMSLMSEFMVRGELTHKIWAGYDRSKHRDLHCEEINATMVALKKRKRPASSSSSSSSRAVPPLAVHNNLTSLVLVELILTLFCLRLRLIAVLLLPFG